MILPPGQCRIQTWCRAASIKECARCVASRPSHSSERGRRSVLALRRRMSCSKKAEPAACYEKVAGASHGNSGHRCFGHCPSTGCGRTDGAARLPVHQDRQDKHRAARTNLRQNISSGLWTSAESGRSWEGGCVIGAAQRSQQLMVVPATGESRRRIVFGEFRRLRGQFVLSRRCPDSWHFAKMLRRRQVTKTVFVSHHESI